ncbi:hypothetical protein [Nonomuraea polychroma]|uniref:hypothetical protein n=1 Tax=Nonomuraea polychroma TaxID=46176 RepID=UPI0019D45542|nr:hypothetical protein [Nonomuraea polychroma]
MTDTLRPAETALPQEPGSPQKLRRSIGVVGGTLLTLSCVTPASTIFVIVPDLRGGNTLNSSSGGAADGGSMDGSRRAEDLVMATPISAEDASQEPVKVTQFMIASCT